MSGLLQAIGDVLRPVLLQRGTIRLEETDPASKTGLITLHRAGPGIVLRPDLTAGARCTRNGCNAAFTAPDRLFPLFRLDIPGLASMCDYIVFAQDSTSEGAPLFVLHCELKSGNASGSKRQMENGRILSEYVLAMATRHHSLRERPRVLHRGIVFSPKYPVPRGSLERQRCNYAPFPDALVDLPVAHYASGKDYPLTHFCV